MLAKNLVLEVIQSYIRSKKGESKIVMDIDMIYTIVRFLAELIRETEGREVSVSRDVVRKVLNQLAREGKLRKVVYKNRAYYIALEPLEVNMQGEELDMPLEEELSEDDLAYYSEVLEIE